MITYTIEKFNHQELDDLADRTGLDESIDYGCEFIVARNGNIAGVAGVNFDKEVYPRFEHIIVDPKYQKGSLGGKLMFRMESRLKELGFYHYVSFIYHGRKIMHRYAKHWEMIPFGYRPKGIWYFKSIGAKSIGG